MVKDTSVGLEGEKKQPEAVWLGSNVLEVRWYGYVEKETVEVAVRRLHAAVVGKPPVFVVINALKITGYALSVRNPSLEFLGLLKSSGMQRMVAIMPNSAIRMFLSALAMVTGTKISFVENRMQASEELRKHGALSFSMSA